MSLAKLAEIEARAEKAEKGPWTADHMGGYVWGPRTSMIADQVSDHETKGAGSVARARGWGRLTGTGGRNLSPDSAAAIQADNLTFIAAARADVPALCRSLRIALEALETGCITPTDHDCPNAVAYQAALAELSK